MRRNIAALAFSAAVALSGCSLFTTENPRAPVDLQKISQTAAVDTVWSTSLGDSPNTFLVPAVAGNAVYAAGGKDVYRIDPATGRKVWDKGLGSEVTAGVGSDGYYVAAGTAKAEIVTLSAEGNEIWRKTLPSELLMPPLVGNELVIAYTTDTRITAFRASSGEEAWHYQGRIPLLSLRVPRQMVFFADGILVGQTDGRMVGVNFQGKQALEAAISQPSGITEVERLNDVVGAPLITPSLLCASSYQGRLTCMNLRNGATRWSVKVDAATGPSADRESVFVVDSKGVIHAYSMNNGKEIWTNDTMRYRANTAPVPIGSYLASADSDGYIHILDPESGREVGRDSISGPVRTQPVPYGDGAIFQTEEGKIAYIRARSRN